MGQPPSKAASARKIITATGAKLISTVLTRSDIKLGNLVQDFEDFRREQRGWFSGVLETIESLNAALTELGDGLGQVLDDQEIALERIENHIPFTDKN